MSIQRSGSQPSSKGAAEYFTGEVQVEPLFKSPGPAPVAGARVTFEPGARSNWHTHPCGQILIVVSGLGWHQCEGEPKEEIGRATSSPVRRTRSTGTARPTRPR